MPQPRPLNVLIVDDENITACYLRDVLRSLRHDADLAQGGEEALELARRKRYDLVIADLVMPGMDGPTLVRRMRETLPKAALFVASEGDTADAKRRTLGLGVDEYLEKPVHIETLRSALARTLESGPEDPSGMGRWSREDWLRSHMVGSSAPMDEVKRRIEQARASNAHVLIQGESGTGKELVARAVWRSRKQGQGDFVAVNCCAISEGLMESELFGHARGAFSGAISDREGLFEAADGGTIFLDEIGDLPLQSQTKLLRILQEGELRRVGENRMRYVNVRVIAATNANLEDSVRRGSFRQDLFYRLNVIPIHLPPLRHRLVDLPELVEHFLDRYSESASNRPRLGPGALEPMMTYNFPGNVRELENIVQRAISFADGNILSREDIENCLRTQSQPTHQPAAQTITDLQLTYPALKAQMRKQERDYLCHMLKLHKGRITDAARAMGIARTALHNRIRKLGLGSKNLL